MARTTSPRSSPAPRGRGNRTGAAACRRGPPARAPAPRRPSSSLAAAQPRATRARAPAKAQPSSFELARRDGVLEALRIELVETFAARLAVRIHEIRQP